MGTDIHVYLLKKHSNGDLEEICLFTRDSSGKYEKASIGESRNYPLFAKLADICGCENQISYVNEGFVPDCPREIERECEYFFGFDPHWYAWDTLYYCAKAEGKVEYNEDYPEDFNIVDAWLQELRVVLEANCIYNTSNIYIQIFFDN